MQDIPQVAHQLRRSCAAQWCSWRSQVEYMSGRILQLRVSAVKAAGLKIQETFRQVG